MDFTPGETRQEQSYTPIAKGDRVRTRIKKALAPKGSTGTVEDVIYGGLVDPHMPPIYMVCTDRGGPTLRYRRSEIEPVLDVEPERESEG